eukprot:761560-Hanusia_phi.AAC.2
MSDLIQTQEGKLKPVVDQQACKLFQGLECVPDAIEYMYAGKNIVSCLRGCIWDGVDFMLHSATEEGLPATYLKQRESMAAEVEA